MNTIMMHEALMLALGILMPVIGSIIFVGVTMAKQADDIVRDNNQIQ